MHSLYSSKVSYPVYLQWPDQNKQTTLAMASAITNNSSTSNDYISNRTKQQQLQLLSCAIILENNAFQFPLCKQASGRLRLLSISSTVCYVFLHINTVTKGLRLKVYHPFV